MDEVLVCVVEADSEGQDAEYCGHDKGVVVEGDLTGFVAGGQAPSARMVLTCRYSAGVLWVHCD